MRHAAVHNVIIGSGYKCLRLRGTKAKFIVYQTMYCGTTGASESGIFNTCVLRPLALQVDEYTVRVSAITTNHAPNTI